VGYCGISCEWVSRSGERSANLQNHVNVGEVVIAGDVAVVPDRDIRQALERRLELLVHDDQPGPAEGADRDLIHRLGQLALVAQRPLAEGAEALVDVLMRQRRLRRRDMLHVGEEPRRRVDLLSPAARSAAPDATASAAEGISAVQRCGWR
jgi:hypothetical protein